MTAKKFAYVPIALATICATQGAAVAANTITTTNPAITNYARPVSFEPNRGQTDKQVDFLAHGTGYSLFLSHAEAVMVLHDVTVRMRPVGANASIPTAALDEQPSKSNYFIGNVPERWRTDIPNYAKVRYANVYPGVDLIYYGNQRQLEYDFVVKPGADLGNISLDFEGPAKAELDGKGNLLMHTGVGDVQWHKPVAYQEVNGRRNLVGCAYAPRGGLRFGFRLDAYDPAKPLIIDPELEYSTYLGGSFSDQGFAIAVDTRGNAYVTGTTTSDDFPIKDAFQSVNRGSQVTGSTLGNAFITKFDTTGKLIYSTFLGGSGNLNLNYGDYGYGIAVDASGYAYVTGLTGSTDFPVKNAFQGVMKDAFTAFVVKIGVAGNALVYSTYLGGSGGNFDLCGPLCGDAAEAIALDARGDAYVTGYTSSLDFPTKNGFEDTYPAGSTYAGFVTKLSREGNELIYSTYIGGTGGMTNPVGIAVDVHGSAYITGSTLGNLPTKHAFQSEYPKAFCEIPGFSAAFVTKLNATGDELIYSTYLGGHSCSEDYARGIALDVHEHAYVTGATYSPDFPIKDAFQKHLKTRFGSAFVTKLDAAGNALVYSTYLGGSGDATNNAGDTGAAIDVDREGQAYVTGLTNSTDFPTKNAFQPVYGGAGDAFITKLCPVGTLDYSTYLGGSDRDQGGGIALNTAGDAYLTGITDSTDFPTKNAFQPMLGGLSAANAFVTRVSAH